MFFDNRLRLYLVLLATFVTSLLIGDIIGSKLTEVTVFGHAFTISVGMVPFPVTFLLTDLLNEFYGKRAARQVTWIGFAMALLAFAFIFISVAIPFAPFTFGVDWTGTNKSAFDTVFAGSQRILAASLVAYIFSQFTDIAVFHALKKLTHNRLLWLRATGSTVVSQLIDTAIIQTIAWYGLLPAATIVNIAISSYAVKLVVAIALTPLIYAGHAILARWLDLHPVVLDDNGDPVPEPLASAAVVSQSA